MSRRFTSKIVTASSLVEGDVVYLAADDAWVRDHRDAEFLEDEAHAQLRLIEARGRVSEVVDVCLADAVAGPDGPQPVHSSEVTRTRGPSNHFVGKQAQRAPAAEPGPRATC